MPHSKSIQKLFEFLRLVRCLEKSPSFSSALGLSYNAISSLPTDQLSFEKPFLKLRVPLSSKLYLSNQTSVALSTYLAIIDDVTTWALVLSDPRRSRAGVSVSLRTEWGPAAFKCKPGDSVEISAKTIKVGRNLGFCTAQVREASSGELVCFGSHVKYLPMGFFADFLVSSFGWPLARFYANNWSPVNDSDDLNDEMSLANAFESFRIYAEERRATFVAFPYHASLGGPLHGGCQAILMELLATDIAKREFGADDSPQVKLESMSVEYLSPPNAKIVELQVESIKHLNDSMTLRVQLLCGGKLRSEGILSFSRGWSTLQSRL